MVEIFQHFGLVSCIGILLLLGGVTLGNAAGIGGAGIILPILLICFSLNLLESSALCNFMICIGFFIRLLSNLKQRHPKKNRPLIDYDCACLMIPPSLFGTRIGYIIHGICPQPILLMCLTVTLWYLSYISFLQGQIFATSELQNKIVSGEALLGITKNEIEMGILPHAAPSEENKKQLEDIYIQEAAILPVKKVLLILILFILLIATIFIEGGENITSILGIKECSMEYWGVLAAFGIYCLLNTMIIGRDSINLYSKKVSLNYPNIDNEVAWTCPIITKYSLIGLCVGILSAIYGIGGGMILTPMLLQLKLLPEVVASTGGVFGLLTTGSSCIILFAKGYFELRSSVIMAMVSLGASLLSLKLVKDILVKYGRPSVLVFILTGIIFISGFTITAVRLYQSHLKYGSVFSPEYWVFFNFCK